MMGGGGGGGRVVAGRGGGTAGAELSGGDGGSDQPDATMAGGSAGADDIGEGGAAGGPDVPVACTTGEYDDGTSCHGLTACGVGEFEQSPPKPDQDRVCAKLVQCGANEYEKAAPTGTTNRECSPLSACGAGTFVSVKPTANANRQCSPCTANTFSSTLNVTMCGAWSTCKSGETESVAPSTTTDRVCSTCGAGKYASNGQCVALTACKATEYEATPATASSDRKCSALTVCQAGSRQTAAPTATTDRQCAACSSGTFSTQTNASSCSAWTTCTATQYQSVAPSLLIDRLCTAVTSCAAGTRIKTAATATSDRICQACDSGTFTTAANLSSCSTWANCAAGFSAAAGSATKDRTCNACAAGFFSTTTNAGSCSAWKTCSSNQTLTKAGTTTSDAVCTNKPTCGTAVDRVCTADCPCAGGEGVCTASTQCASGVTCVAGSGKKVGRTGDTCLANHCNNDTKDSGETSVDCGGECGCRATFDTIAVKGLPADRNAFYALAMSRDGKRLAGTLKKGNNSFPGYMAMDGTVTALQSYSQNGYTMAASTDGSVLLGLLGCANPPTCSDTTVTTYTWTGSAAPKATGTYGNPRGISGSGAIVVGDDYNTTSGSYYGFYKPTGKNTSAIDAISLVVGVTPDGGYVVGNSLSGGSTALWEAQTGNITPIISGAWSIIHASAINGVGANPTVIGDAYISASDSRVGFRWKGGVMTELATLSTGNFITASGVSQDGGTVVGIAGPSGNQAAFIWTDAAKRRTIVDELRARGLEPAIDFTLGGSSFISDDGKTIVGSETENTFWRVVLQ
ncbi:MAG: hypothetical protein ABIQ16_00800 [Polyangiaceae bacterium]